MRRTRVGLALSVAFVAASCGGEGDLTVGTTTFPSGPIELRVDTLGVPHVYASTDLDAFYGAGYAMARDRLFQMEMNRLRVDGRFSEIFGSVREKDDRLAHAMNFRALGANDVARMRRERPADARLLDAWAAGINRRIEEVRTGAAPRPYGLGNGPEELDYVPEPWVAEDGASIGKFLGFGLSNTLDSEVLATAVLGISREFAEIYPLQLPAFDAFAMRRETPTTKKAKASPPPSIARDAVRATSAVVDRPLRFLLEHAESNNWAVGREKTDTGMPLLAGDPHQALTSPTRLYPLHMSSVGGGGTLDVIGFAFVGTPGVQLGHNAHVGWTATTAFADAMDLWGVDTNDDETRVLVPGGDAAIVERKITIKVRRPGQPFGVNDDKQIVVRDVPGYGVLLPDDALPLPKSLLTGSDEILFSWTGFRPTLEGLAYLDMDRAKNVDAWEKAVDVIEVGGQNFIAADRSDISYHVHMSVPDRGDPSARPMPWRLLPLESADQLWTRGDLPADKLPHERNPARGFLGTANADPFGFTADGNVENDPYYYGAFFANGSRAYRIDEALKALLATGKKVTRADMEAMHADVHSVMADSLVPKIEAAMQQALTDPSLGKYRRPELIALVDALSKWDRRMDGASGTALFFLGVQWFGAKRVALPKLADLLFEGIAEKSPPFFIGALRNVVEGRFARWKELAPDGVPALLLAAVDEASQWLQQTYGTQDLSKLALKDALAAEFPSPFGHRLTLGRYPIGGSTDTINVAPAPFFDKKGDTFVGKKEFTVTEMSLYRMVIGFDPDGTPRATVDFAQGSSEEPGSRHYDDRQKEWLDVAHVPLHFKRDDVERATESRVVLAAP